MKRTVPALTRMVVATAVACVVVGEGGLAMAQQGNSTPFSQTYRRPTVSPYLQLQQQGLNPLQNQNIYQTMVQPQLQQQQQQIQQLQQGRQLSKLQNQVQQIERGTSARQIDETIRPTGSRATYMNYSHFYPAQR